MILLVNEIFRLVAMVVEKNIPVSRVLSLFVFTLPYILAVTIPIGVLVGTIFAVGRLSSDSEVTAMRASGVSILQVFYPCYWFGLATTIAAILFFQFVLPWGNQNYVQTRFRILKGNPALNLLQNQVLVVQGMEIMVDSVDVKKQKLYKVRIIDHANKKIIFAEYGQFLPRDNKNNVFPLRLFFTTTQPYGYFGEIINRERLESRRVQKKRLSEVLKKERLENIENQLKRLRNIQETRSFNDTEKLMREKLVAEKKRLVEGNTENPQAGFVKKKKIKEFEERWDKQTLIYIQDGSPANPQFTGPQMASISELIEYMGKTKMMIKMMQLRMYIQLVEVKKELRSIEKQLKENLSDKNLKKKRAELFIRIRGIKDQIEKQYSGGNIYRQIVFNLHSKLSMPFACFFFAMIAAPLGVYSKRSGKGIGIGIALLVLIGYRILMLVGNLGYTKNIMSPVIGAWLPNVLTVLAAFYFTYEKVTGKSLQFRFDFVIEKAEGFKKWWDKKDLTVMQIFFYLFSFPARLPFKVIKRIIRWYRVDRFVQKPAKGRKEKAIYDDIFGQMEYTRRTQHLPKDSKIF
jgi:lipopolysaccharide export LptBFGC system permease protein LptF